jgi:ribosomal protein S27E
MKRKKVTPAEACRGCRGTGEVLAHSYVPVNCTACSGTGYKDAL